MTLDPYIHFKGNCEEALNFYSRCFGGEITGLQHFSDSPTAVPDEMKKKVLHARFEFGGNLIMASDSTPEHNISVGNNFSLSMNMNDVAETEKIFNNLAEGGVITMPLQDQFWGARFGMLTDRYGINWMFNCELKK